MSFKGFVLTARSIADVVVSDAAAVLLVVENFIVVVVDVDVFPERPARRRRKWKNGAHILCRKMATNWWAYRNDTAAADITDRWLTFTELSYRVEESTLVSSQYNADQHELTQRYIHRAEVKSNSRTKTNSNSLLVQAHSFSVLTSSIVFLCANISASSSQTDRTLA